LSEAKPTVVLCVDHDPRALIARRMVLSTAGYDVLTAFSGEDALRILHRRHVDLVIADAFLPRFTGAQIANAIKSHDPQIRVVLLTGAPELPAGVKADLVLIKGRAPTAFLAEIAAVLERQRAEELDRDHET
jgi:DNA-binding response OmpR family regulator